MASCLTASGDLRLWVVSLYFAWVWPSSASDAAWTGEAAAKAPTASALAATRLVRRLRRDCSE